MACDPEICCLIKSMDKVFFRIAISHRFTDLRKILLRAQLYRIH